VGVGRFPAGFVIASRDRRASLLSTLARLESLPEHPPVVVVDNASADGTAAAVRRAHPRVRVIALDENLGAAARTIGVRSFWPPQQRGYVWVRCSASLTLFVQLGSVARPRPRFPSCLKARAPAARGLSAGARPKRKQDDGGCSTPVRPEMVSLSPGAFALQALHVARFHEPSPVPVPDARRSPLDPALTLVEAPRCRVALFGVQPGLGAPGGAEGIKSATEQTTTGAPSLASGVGVEPRDLSRLLIPSHEREDALFIHRDQVGRVPAPVVGGLNPIMTEERPPGPQCRPQEDGADCLVVRRRRATDAKVHKAVTASSLVQLQAGSQEQKQQSSRDPPLAEHALEPTPAPPSHASLAADRIEPPNQRRKRA
jgi:Glycosyl transferase family 2